MPPTGQLCPQLDSCAPNWSAVPPTGQLCPQLVSYAPSWTAMPPARQLCPQLVSYAPSRTAVPPAGQLCSQPTVDYRQYSCDMLLQSYRSHNSAESSVSLCCRQQCCCSLTEATTVLSPASVSAVDSIAAAVLQKPQQC